MKLYYYFTENCSSCKEYYAVAEQLAIDFDIREIEKIDVGKHIAKHAINGVPTIIVEDNEGIECFRSLGNAPLKYVEMEYDKRGAC